MANPTNTDLQRQIQSLQVETRAGFLASKETIDCMSAKLDRALEQSAKHDAQITNQGANIEKLDVRLDNESKARDGQFMWLIGVAATSILALLGAAAGFLRGK